ncbi:MAG: GDCCVxC domain-containing (seleno)protein [Xanthobacteraceae bacterium]
MSASAPPFTLRGADSQSLLHECTGCGAMLRPEHGDCCVFCSYGSAPCPPIQAGLSSATGAIASCAG